MTVTIQGIEEITEMIAGGTTEDVTGAGDLWISSFAYKDQSGLQKYPCKM